MRTVPFHKVQGLANDFVLIDAIDDATLACLPWERLTPAWCDRRTGIGADGVLILTRSTSGDCAMRIVNADGSGAQMCGNGIRCVARYLKEHRGFSDGRARIETGRGVLDVAWRGEGRAFVASIGMGEPILAPARIPVVTSDDRAVEIEAPLEAGVRDAGGVEGVMTCVSMGNPHAVLFCRDASGADLAGVARRLQTHAMFPESVNVHLVQVHSRSHATVRSFERGAGETPACGTGACAVLVAGVLTDRLDRAATLTLRGGDLSIAWEAHGLVMTGPGELSCRGEITID